MRLEPCAGTRHQPRLGITAPIGGGDAATSAIRVIRRRAVRDFRDLSRSLKQNPAQLICESNYRGIEVPKFP